LGFEISCFYQFCLIVWKQCILWMIIVQTCFKSLIKCLGMFICCWVMDFFFWRGLLGFGLLVMFGLNCGKMSFWRKINMILNSWWNDVMNLWLKVFWLLTKFMLCFWVNWDENWGFCEIFGCVSEREPTVKLAQRVATQGVWGRFWTPLRGYFDVCDYCFNFKTYWNIIWIGLKWF